VLRMEPLGHTIGLRLAGELAGVDAELAESTFARLAEIGGHVTLDMSGVTFMDSFGLSKILVLASQLRDRGSLTLANVQAPQMRVFELVNPGRTFPNLHFDQV
jgi:anti-anti-sigma factor